MSSLKMESSAEHNLKQLLLTSRQERRKANKPVFELVYLCFVWGFWLLKKLLVVMTIDCSRAENLSISET